MQSCDEDVVQSILLCCAITTFVSVFQVGAKKINDGIGEFGDE
jgi:hypothetical protein